MEVSGIWPSEAEEIRDASIVGGSVDGAGNLVLVNYGGAEFNAGVVRPPVTEPGRATFYSSDIMNGQSTTAGTFWYNATFFGAIDDVVPDNGQWFQTNASGIRIVQAGVYDLSLYVKTPNGYAANAVFGCRLNSDPFMGTDDIDFGSAQKPPGSIHGVASFHRFRVTIAAMTTIKMQVLATNPGGGWDPAWAGKIQVRKSW